MRCRLVLLFLALMSACALAQREGKFEVSVGIGNDINRLGTTYTNDHNRSASICYNPADDWGVAIYVGQQVYSLDQIDSQYDDFLDRKSPLFSKTVTSVLLAYRYFIPTESKVFNPYVSVGFGYAKSVLSPEGYYVYRGMYSDTVYYRKQSGQFALGLLSPGIQIRPVSFLDLFAELQIALASNVDLSPGPLAYSVGVGVIF